MNGFNIGGVPVALFGPVLLIIWIWQALNCWRRAELPSLFGSQKRARYVWLTSFLLFDPIQLLLYVGIVRFRWLGSRMERLGSWVLCLGLLWMGILVYGLPGGADQASFVLTEPPRESSTHIAASVQGLSTSSSTGWTSNASSSPIALGNLRVLCESDDPLVLQVGKLISAKLIALPYVKRVSFVPLSADLDQAEGQPAPDFTLLLRASEINTLPLPMWYRSSGRLAALFARGIDGFENTNSHRDERFQFGRSSWAVRLGFTYSRCGIVWGSARLGLQAAGLAESIADPLIEFINQRQKANFPMQTLPHQAEYRAIEDPKALSKRRARRWFSETAFMVHNRTLWTYEQAGNTKIALKELGAELELEGWKSYPGEEMLTARRGDEILVAGRPGYAEPEPETGSIGADGSPVQLRITWAMEPRGVRGPIRVIYEGRYSESELDQLVQTIVEEDGDPLHRLLLHRQLTPAQLIRLREQLVAQEPYLPGRWLRIADLAEKAGDQEAQALAVRMARIALGAGLDDGATKSTIDALAEELGVSDEPASTEELEAFGFQSLELSDSREFTIPLGESLRLICTAAEGERTTLLISPIVIGELLNTKVRITVEGQAIWGERSVKYGDLEEPIVIWNAGVNSTYCRVDLVRLEDQQVTIRVLLN